MWLLSEAVDIGSFLCQPLCGPDNFTDDETSKLSDMLIYMPEDKKIEDNIDIRLLLLQALTQVCECTHYLYLFIFVVIISNVSCTHPHEREENTEEINLVLSHDERSSHLPAHTVMCMNGLSLNL